MRHVKVHWFKEQQRPVPVFLQHFLDKFRAHKLRRVEAHLLKMLLIPHLQNESCDIKMHVIRAVRPTEKRLAVLVVPFKVHVVCIYNVHILVLHLGLILHQIFYSAGKIKLVDGLYVLQVAEVLVLLLVVKDIVHVRAANKVIIVFVVKQLPDHEGG